MKCGVCDKEHGALSEMEPAFRRPDAFVALSPAERAKAHVFGDDVCLIGHPHTNDARYFVRGILPVPVTNRATPTAWGIWVEVSPASLDTIMDLWKSPDQDKEPPFSAKLANHVPGYAETIGLPCTLQLTGLKTRPHVTLYPAEHEFVRECLKGVSTARIVAWMHAMIGPSPAAPAGSA